MASSTSPLPFNELFAAIESDALTALHITILKLKTTDSSMGHERIYNLLNQEHPQKKITALQFAVINYPRTSIKLMKVLLDYGAGTELPIDYEEPEPARGNCDVQNCTPLWIAIREKYPIELVRLLLDYKADVFFKSNCDPFKEDEKGSSITKERSFSYSLLHLAVKVSSPPEILNLLLSASSDLLLKDHDNPTSETPLIMAVKKNDLQTVKLLFTSDNALEAYELAARNHFVEICLHLSDDKLKHNDRLIWYLEIFEKINESTWQSQSDLNMIIRDLDEADELLPIDGYWEWADSAWKREGRYFYRLRRLIEISDDHFYLKESINLVVKSNSFTTGNYQQAMKILLEGLQRENDSEKKSRAASYFQRLLQRSGTPTLGLLDNLSRSNLVILSEGNHEQVQRMTPPVTRSFPDLEDEESDDSLLYCPVCSHKFSQDRESHLKSCLKTPPHRLIGNRYTRASAGSNGECPICYEELGRSGGGVVVMNCLCKFHEKCIEDWIGRGKQCPYHHE